MKKVITSLLSLFLVLTLVACGSKTPPDNKIPVSKAATDLKGKNFKDINTILTSDGFTNIEFEKIEDLITGWLTKDGEVERVSINGETTFSAKTKFAKDAKVVIAYHTFKPQEPESTQASTVAATTSLIETKPATTTASNSIVDAENFDIEEINNTNSEDSDSKYVGKVYKIKGEVSQAIQNEVGENSLIIIWTDVLAKGMGETMPLQIKVWLQNEEFESIGGTSAKGKKVELVKELVMIDRNTGSNDEKIKGFPKQFEFGNYESKILIPIKTTEGEIFDYNEINNTNSKETDSLYVGKLYKIKGKIDMLVPSEDGYKPFMTFWTDILSKGMGNSLPLEVNVWLTDEEFESIGGLTAVGKEIELVKELISIDRNMVSKNPEVLGYPIQFEFGKDK